jgi:hypothetical protein
MTGGLSGLDGTRLLYGPAKQQQFFSQSGLAGIGMADDSEIPPSIHFSSMVFIHVKTLNVAFRQKNRALKARFKILYYYNAFIPKVNGTHWDIVLRTPVLGLTRKALSSNLFQHI